MIRIIGFIAGIIVEAILFIVALIQKDMNMFMKVSAYIGLVAIGLSAFSTWMSSDNVFKKTIVENSNERVSRLNLALNLFIFGIPGLIGFFISSYLY